MMDPPSTLFSGSLFPIISLDKNILLEIILMDTMLLISTLRLVIILAIAFMCFLVSTFLYLQTFIGFSSTLLFLSFHPIYAY